jgi:hypothetical protein
LEDLMKVLKIAAILLFVSGLASAAPCTQGVSVRPENPVSGDPVSIFYSAPFLGFVLTPTIAVVGNQITIDQPTVHADPAYPGQIPCGERLVLAGDLVAGNYNVTVRLGSFPAMTGSFTVRPALAVCGYFPALPMPAGPQLGTIAASVSASGRATLLHFENRFIESVAFLPIQAPFLGAPAASIEGYQINITQPYASFGAPSGAGPTYYGIFCQSEDLDLGALPAGKYTLVWTYLTAGGPIPVTATFTTGSPRGRAVRGH